MIETLIIFLYQLIYFQKYGKPYDKYLMQFLSFKEKSFGKITIIHMCNLR